MSDGKGKTAMVTPLEKASILIEALPYIKQFYGQTVVIKYGGHAMINPQLKEAVIMDAILMKFVGMHPVLVHGGGPEIDAMLERLGHQSKFINGLRVTDQETMEVVEMVLVGKVNKDIVARINSNGGKAVGLSGRDGNLIQAAPMDGGQLGLVGDVKQVNPEILLTVMAQGYIPVVAPTGVGVDGQSLNINADHVAAEIAVALKAKKLVLLTDVAGIFARREDETSLISAVSLNEIPQLITQGIITGGMVPKVECCVRALQGGVSKTHIIDGRVPHSILLEVFTNQGVGTMVINEEERRHDQ